MTSQRSDRMNEESNTVQARKLVEEVVSRDDTKLNEALLADAIGHLADEVDRLCAEREHRAQVAEYKLERIHQRALKTETTAETADLRGFCLGITGHVLSSVRSTG